MKWLVLLYVGGLSLFHQTEIDSSSDRFLVWSEGRNLTEGDFQLKKNVRLPYAALSYITIRPEVKNKNGMIEVVIEATFDTKRSWMKKNSVSQRLISHEQGHFDIAELHARIIRKEISQSKITSKNVHRKVNRIYKKVMKELNCYSKQYDDITDFSRNEAIQGEWIERIRTELDSLAEFSDPIVYLNN
jgi:hypothetical protein